MRQFPRTEGVSNLSYRAGYTMSLAYAIRRELGLTPMQPASALVFVVDDDVSVRESLELLIQNEACGVETFSSAQEFLDHPRADLPSCLILDVSLPGLNGLDLQQRLGAEQSDLPIIFITGHGDIPMTVRAIKAGAVEFLTKPFSDEILLNSIRQALERSRIVLGQKAQMQELRNCYASLTPRERQVMALVVSGLLNKQIGGDLGISEITVKAHRGQVMHKMKADSVASLVKMAARLGITSASRASTDEKEHVNSGTMSYK